MPQSEPTPATWQPGAGPVTIVVPVYADWDSLAVCIASLKEHVDPRHKVLIVNDCGPQADLLEGHILAATQGCANFEYQRNPANLGFGRTCNRAVFELDRSGNDILLLNSDTMVTAGFLDELQQVLALSPRHGCCGPRSNNATIASVPLVLRDDAAERSFDDARRVHAQLWPLLPRFTVTPVIVGFCMLIRRSVIERFGLFDEIYGRGYGEENDFCLRIGRAGFASVMCHRALVCHFESRSFTSAEKAELMERNEALLLQRYPSYHDQLAHHLRHGVDALDWFADLLFCPGPAALLVDLTDWPPARPVAAVEDVLRTLAAEPGCRTTVLVDTGSPTIVAPPAARVMTVLPPEMLFHVGWAPQVPAEQVLRRLNRRCLQVATGEIDAAALLTSAHAASVDHAALRARWAQAASLEDRAEATGRLRLGRWLRRHPALHRALQRLRGVS